MYLYLLNKTYYSLNLNDKKNYFKIASELNVSSSSELSSEAITPSHRSTDEDDLQVEIDRIMTEPIRETIWKGKD